MSIKTVLAGIAVDDHDAAVEWYEGLFGRAPDDRPMDGLAQWEFSDSAIVQVIAQADRAGRSMLTIDVDDLEAFVGDVRGRGLKPSDVDDQTSQKVLISTIADPDGNAITLVEQRS